MEFLRDAIPITVCVFVVSSMLGVGLTVALEQIVAPLRNARLVALALLANFVLMPLVAVAIVRVLRVDQSLRIGLLLLGTCAGSPFLPKLAKAANSNVAFAAGVMMMLVVVTAGVLPFMAPLLLAGVSVTPAKVAHTLVLLMLLPLGAGLGLNACSKVAAARIAPSLNKISTISIVAMAALMLITNLRNIMDLFGKRGILASILLLLAGSAIGWFLGGEENGVREVLSLGTAQRNISASLVVAERDLMDAKAAAMVAIAALIGLALLFSLARLLARRGPGSKTNPEVSS